MASHRVRITRRVSRTPQPGELIMERITAKTYRDILKELLSLPDARLDDTATVYVKADDEFYGITESHITSVDGDILDADHYFLQV